MWRRFLVSLVILQMKDLTMLAQSVQPALPSNTKESIKDKLQPLTNRKSTALQVSAPDQEIQLSKQPPDQTSEDISSYQDQPARQDTSFYLDQTNKASTFLKELQTGVPESMNDDVVPFKATSDYLKKNSLVEEGSKNETYSERFVYMPRGGNEIVPCTDKIELKSTVKSITHTWTDYLGKDIRKRRQSRLKVDDRFQLSIVDAQPEDVGIYHCLLTLAYTESGEDITTDNLVSLNVYINPDLALEFPFVFESMTCNKERDSKKLDAIKSIICTTTPCVYEFEMTCSVEPWLHKNMPYIPRSKLLILVTKFPDPDYKPPECNRDCIMGNKFDHLLANLQVVKKVIDTTTNDSDLTYFSGLTMSNRKLVYSCDAGFSLFRESCVPCFPGTYNPKRRINLCVPCPVSTYTDQPGARDCLQCETGKRTDAVGADSIKKCIDKEIKIIRFRMAFFILCGVVCGLLGIILAIIIVRIRERMKTFFIPGGKPKRTPSESSKLLTTLQHKPALETIHENDQPLEKKPSSKKLSATTIKPNTLQPVVQGARDRMWKSQEERSETNQGAPDTKALQAAGSNQMVHRSSNESAIRSKEIVARQDRVEEELKKKKSESSLKIHGSMRDAGNTVTSVTDHLSSTTAKRAASQHEVKAAPEMLKRSHSQLAGIIRQSVHDAASLASAFTVPTSDKMSKATSLSKQTKQLTPAPVSQVSLQPSNQTHTPQLLTQQYNLPLNFIPQPSKTPSNAINTSNQPSSLPTNTGNIKQLSFPSANMSVYQAQPMTAPSDQPQAQPVRVPSGASQAQPVGQIRQPPDHQGPPSHNSPQTTPLSNSQPTWTNPQDGISTIQVDTNVPSAAGQVPQRAPSNNLNQNAVFVNGYSSNGGLKWEGLEPYYAKRSSSVRDSAPRGQYFVQQPLPYNLYDQVLWMPNATAASSRTNILSTKHSRSSLPPQQSPSNTTFN